MCFAAIVFALEVQMDSQQWQLNLLLSFLSSFSSNSPRSAVKAEEEQLTRANEKGRRMGNISQRMLSTVLNSTARNKSIEGGTAGGASSLEAIGALVRIGMLGRIF